MDGWMVRIEAVHESFVALHISMHGLLVHRFIPPWYSLFNNFPAHHVTWQEQQGIRQQMKSLRNCSKAEQWMIFGNREPGKFVSHMKQRCYVEETVELKYICWFLMTHSVFPMCDCYFSLEKQASSEWNKKKWLEMGGIIFAVKRFQVHDIFMSFVIHCVQKNDN